MCIRDRLQVEHPVTEAITGLDLVEWQLRVASGEALPLRQEQLTRRGHAIEARLCAENPDNQFLPATGHLRVFALPPHVAFERGTGERPRVDAGVRQGDDITPHYDSMIAKLIVWGEDRAQALARLDAALAHCRIVGVANNVPFLRRVLSSRSFAQADLDTALITREHDHLFGPGAVPADLAAAAVVAHSLLSEQRRSRQSRAAGAGPFAAHDGWRLAGTAQRRVDFATEADEPALAALLEYLPDGSLMLRVGGVSGALVFEAVEGEADAVLLHHAGRRLQAWVHADERQQHVYAHAGYRRLALADPRRHAGDAAEAGGQLTAPMPGKVVAFHVEPGATVSRGQPLAVMEAMKMEHTISAPADGVVAELLYAPGDQVAEGAALLTLKQAA